MPHWMTVEDPEYMDDMTWEDDEALYEDELNDSNQQSDTVPG